MVIGIDASRAFIREKTGTENYSYHVIKAMLRLPESRQHSFVLFTRPNPILPIELSLYSNIIVKEVKLKYLWTQLGLAWETWRIPRLDALWIPAHTLPVLRKPGIRTVVTIHGLEYQWLPEYKNLLQRWYLPLSTIYATKAADKLIAVSKFSAKQLEKELHTSPKKIKVILEGVERLHSRSVGALHSGSVWERYGLQQKQYLLFVGSLQPRKNLVALIEAFAIFSRVNPEYKLVIAGGVGWMAEDIFRAPGKFGVQDKVIFTGRVSDLDLQTLYESALVYVQPSITEGFGLPILEAMNAGVPVISSNGGALSEVVGKAGRIVKLGVDFVKLLASTMKDVVGDKKLQNTLIAIGYKIIRELSWDRAAKATLVTIVGEGYSP